MAIINISYMIWPFFGRLHNHINHRTIRILNFSRNSLFIVMFQPGGFLIFFFLIHKNNSFGILYHKREILKICLRIARYYKTASGLLRRKSLKDDPLIKDEFSSLTFALTASSREFHHLTILSAFSSFGCILPVR